MLQCRDMISFADVPLFDQDLLSVHDSLVFVAMRSVFFTIERSSTTR